MSKLKVTRLLQNPLGQVAPDGQRGDLVQITDGRATVYLVPFEYEIATEAQLRDMLAAKLVPEPPRAGRHAPPAQPPAEASAGGALRRTIDDGRPS